MHADSASPDIHEALVEFARQGRPAALAVVLQADGSTPGRVGAKALIDADGHIQGTVGGGSMEAAVQLRATKLLPSALPAVLEFNMQHHTLRTDRAICGGAMRVLIDPTAGRHQEAYAAAVAMRRARRRGVLLTAIRGCDPCHVDVQCFAEEAVPPDLEFPGSDAVRSTLQQETARLMAAGPASAEEPCEVLVEPLIPDPRLLVLGGGHVGQAVAAQATLVGFDVVVLDDRPEFTRPELFPGGVTARCGRIADEIDRFPLRPDTYVVIVTRGHRQDAEALAACIHEPTAYVGMIGSRRKVAMMRRDFIESGRSTPAEFDRVFAPIGLDIGAVTVPEIAACIVAQLIAVRRTGASPRVTARQALHD